LNAQRLERASNSNKPVTELTALVRHTPLWDDVNDVLARAAVPGQSLTTEEEKLVVAALMGNILQKNFQRPGAAAQATLQEFNSIQKVNEGGEEVRVMRVARHKTARKGPAYLTMTANDHKLLKKYVKRVRPRLDPAAQLDLLFIRRGPKQVKDVNALLNFLKGKYGLVIGTSTNLRKSGETASFQTLTVKESELVSRHMSHTPQTAARYYQAVVGKREAARAHVLRAKLYEEIHHQLARCACVPSITLSWWQPYSPKVHDDIIVIAAEEVMVKKISKQAESPMCAKDRTRELKEGFAQIL